MLAQVPHRHIGFGIPKRLRWLFKRNRSLLSLLPQAAAQAVRQMYRELAPAGDIGLVLTVQTNGQFLNFNPHLHGFLASGSFDPCGTFQPLPALDTDKLAELFAYYVLRRLLKLGLISQEVAEQILSQRHTGFPLRPLDASVLKACVKRLRGTG